MEAQAAYNTLPRARGHARPGAVPGSTVSPGTRRRSSTRRPLTPQPPQDAARERAAKKAYHELTSGLRDAQSVMNAVAPPKYDGPPAPVVRHRRPAAAARVRPRDGATPGANPTGGPIGPYATSTNGTHVHASGSTRSTGAGWCRATSADTPRPAAAAPLPGLRGHHGRRCRRAARSPVPRGGAARRWGSRAAAASPGVIGGGSTGSLAGGAVGGLAGMLGGAGGALGALRGGATSAALRSRAARRRWRRAVRPAPPPPRSAARHARPRSAPPRAVSSAGPPHRVHGHWSTTGTTAGPRCGRSSGRPGAMVPGSGSAAGPRRLDLRRWTRGLRSLRCRSRGGDLGRRPRRSLLDRACGRAGAAGAGARAGRLGTAPHGSGGSAGHGKDDKDAKRKSMVFEDDDAWLDDDESGPDVIR